MLELIGLTEEHAVVYRDILRVHSTTRGELASRLDKPEGHVRALMEDLEQRGLIARPAAHPDRVTASPPALALRPFLIDHENSLRAAHEELAGLSELYREGAGERTANDVVEVVMGADAVRQRFMQLQAAATREVRVFVLSDIAFITAADNDAEGRALQRGVQYRVIVESGVLDRPGFLESARASAPYGERVRVMPSLPTRLVIADDELALLPMRTHGEDRVRGALLVHPSGLLDLITAMFERFWETATEFLSDELPVGDEATVDRDLLKLLLLGLTDAGAAAQLGISARTVQRRLAELMSRAGVTTRMQLGAEAVRREWV